MFTSQLKYPKKFTSVKLTSINHGVYAQGACIVNPPTVIWQIVGGGNADMEKKYGAHNSPQHLFVHHCLDAIMRSIGPDSDQNTFIVMF